MPRTRVFAGNSCEMCGQTIPANGTTIAQQRKARFCSMTCRRAGSTRRDSTCEQCGKTFSVTASIAKQRFCSVTCRSASGRREVICEHCGKTSSFKANRAESSDSVTGPACLPPWDVSYVPKSAPRLGKPPAISTARTTAPGQCSLRNSRLRPGNSLPCAVDAISCVPQITSRRSEATETGYQAPVKTALGGTTSRTRTATVSGATATRRPLVASLSNSPQLKSHPASPSGADAAGCAESREQPKRTM
jgi:hypothetical protein